MKTRRQQKRRNRRLRKSRKLQHRKNKQRGGSLTAIPSGAVVNMRLDPKDPYSIPITVGKDQAEKIIEDSTF